MNEMQTRERQECREKDEEKKNGCIRLKLCISQVYKYKLQPPTNFEVYSKPLKIIMNAVEHTLETNQKKS